MKATSLITLSLVAAVATPAIALNHGDQPAKDILGVAEAAGTFNTLQAAVRTAGLTEALQTDSALTVFAPTDEAFAQLDQETVALLLQPQNKDELVRVLTYHVVAGNVSAKQAIAAGQADSLEGSHLLFNIRDGRLLVNDSNVVLNDLEASNGTIHAIDKVLLPPGKLNLRSGRLVIGVYDEAPSKAIAAQLGIDRNQTRLITSVSKGGTAEAAGIRAYDIVLTIDGLPGSKLKEAKRNAGYGNDMLMTVLRGGIEYQIRVPVGIETH